MKTTMTNGYTYSTVSPPPLTKLGHSKIHVRKSLFWTACVTITALFLVTLFALVHKMYSKSNVDYEVFQLKFDVENIQNEMQYMSQEMNKIVKIIVMSKNGSVSDNQTKDLELELDVRSTESLNETYIRLDKMIRGNRTQVLAAKSELNQLLREHPEEPQVHVLLAYLYYILTEMQKLEDDPNTDETIFYLDEGIKHSEIALKMDNTSMGAHESHLLVTGQKSLQKYLSPFIRLENSKIGRAEIAWFAKYHPEYYLATATTAVLAFESASLSWIERSAANLLLDDLPSGTYEEALVGFLKVLKDFPDIQPLDLKRVLTYTTLCYIYLGEYDKAYEYLQKSKQIPTTGVFQMVDEKKLESVVEEYRDYFPNT